MVPVCGAASPQLTEPKPQALADAGAESAGDRAAWEPPPRSLLPGVFLGIEFVGGPQLRVGMCSGVRRALLWNRGHQTTVLARCVWTLRLGP